MINTLLFWNTRMKVNQIVNEMTSGSVASVSMPIGKPQRRTNETSVSGIKPADKVMTGATKKKGRYANSVLESKEKNKVEEAKLDEDDLILVPGQGMKKKTGFVPHGQSRVDHEVEMARSDVLATIKNAKSIYLMLKSKTEDDGLEGWVQEKLIKANDYLNSVKEYYDEKMMHEMSGGVIAGGGVGEGKFTVNRKTGAKLNPRTGAELPPKEKPSAMKNFQPKQPKLTLDDVWRKVEYVVGQIFPDGDPIDWLLPWFRKQGIADHKIGDILERAAKKNGYKDLYDYYDSMKDQYARDNVAEGFSDVIKGVKRSIKGKEHPDVVASKHAGRAIGHYNQGDIAAGDKETNRYVKTRDMHSKAKRVAEGYNEETQYTEETSVINMFEKLVKQGRDPIDMIAHKFGWGSYELDQLAKNLGFNNSAGWANAVRQGKGVNEVVAEGSGPQVGDEVYYGTRLVGWFKGYSKYGKIITEPNVDEMGDEYLSKDVYWDPQDNLTTKPKQGVAEGGILKSIKRGLQGWEKNAVGPGGEKLGDPRDIVKRAKAMDTDTAKKVRSGLDDAPEHSPSGLQKRVLDRRLKGVEEGAKVDRMVKHIAKSERESGKSKDEAENIAWATANKRGYLDNKNKKSHK